MSSNEAALANETEHLYEKVTPSVSVIMAVWNGEKYLHEAVESILGQTLSDFEFIIIDDGSTDRSYELLSQLRDPRLKLFRNKENIGLARSLNIALNVAEGEYIARMDADDIALPERLYTQVEFLEKNSSVVVCGTGVNYFSEDGDEGVSSPPADDVTIRSTLIFGSLIFHPTVMFRAVLFREHAIQYNEQYTCSQDYELWATIANISGARFANVPEPHMRYRKHTSSISKALRKKQDCFAWKCRERQLQRLGFSSERYLKLHQLLVTGGAPSNPLQALLLLFYAARLVKKGCRSGLTALPEVTERKLKNCLRNKGIRKKLLKVYMLAYRKMCSPFKIG